MTDRNKRPDPQLVWQGKIPAIDPLDLNEWRLVRVLLSPAEVEDEKAMGELLAGRPHYWCLEVHGSDAMGAKCWSLHETHAERDESVPASEDVLANIVALLVREARGMKVVR